jgi:hypothetical protein
MWVLTLWPPIIIGSFRPASNVVSSVQTLELLRTGSVTLRLPAALLASGALGIFFFLGSEFMIGRASSISISDAYGEVDHPNIGTGSSVTI